MITVTVDPHTHTLFSGHAFSTVEENARHAAEQGMTAIGMTDHFGFGFGRNTNAPPEFGPSLNMAALPRVIDGVRILAGVEIDIVDFKGSLAWHDTPTPFDPEVTVCDMMLDSREIAIASVHFFPGFREGTVAENTQLYCNVLRHPKIDIIGHPGRAGLPFDIREVLKTAREENKCMEINEHSFDSGEPVATICRDIALGCAELGVSIVVSSDAHSSFYVGKFQRALAMLEEIGFPEELVANATLEQLEKKIGRATWAME